MPREKYRVYAKIIGYVLPGNDEVQLHDCVIKKMSFKEQKARKFKAIESGIKDPGDPRYYKSYITRAVHSDPRFIKTQYVIYCDVDVYDENAALGVAVKLFNKVSGSLALVASSWFNKKHNRKDYQGYQYQLNRVYKLTNDGQEVPVNDLRISAGGWSMICYPGSKNFKELDVNMLSRMLGCRDQVFNKAFKYFLQAEQDYYVQTPPQMLTINLFKCIELIVSSFSKRRSFKKRMLRAAKELNLSREDVEAITKLKKIRDDGDVAHSRSESQSDFYPPQFPVPEDVNFPNFWHSGLTAKVLTNYFLYVDSLINVELSNDAHNDEDELISVNYGAYYEIRPSMHQRIRMVNLVKRKLAEYFGIPYKHLQLKKYQYPKIVFQVRDHLRFNIGTSTKSNTKHKVIISFT